MECLDTLLSEGGYGEGKEEAEVRALACWRPRGSLCLCTLDRSNIEPGTSSVSVSFNTPRLHFAGFKAAFSSSSELVVELPFFSTDF